MEDSWYKSFVKQAIHDLKRKKKTFVYTFEQKEEVLRAVKGSEASYDSNYGCYWITLTEEVKNERTLDSSKKRTKRK